MKRPEVTIEDFKKQAAKEACEYLISLGHNNIASIRYPTPQTLELVGYLIDAMERAYTRGYADGLAENREG